jgi:hypothetical protein
MNCLPKLHFHLRPCKTINASQGNIPTEGASFSTSEFNSDTTKESMELFSAAAAGDLVMLGQCFRLAVSPVGFGSPKEQMNPQTSSCMRGSLDFLLFAVLISGCTSEPHLPDSVQELPCSGHHSEELIRVVKSAESFATQWKQACQQLEVPLVDFGENQVVIYSWGTQPTGGFHLEAYAFDGTALTILRLTPGHNCIVTLSESNPAIVLALPAEATLVVQTKDVTRNCED